jgi:hypothetical protein
MSTSALRLAPGNPAKSPALEAPKAPPEVVFMSDDELLAQIARDRYELGRISGPDLAWTFAVIHECASRMGRVSLVKRSVISSHAALVAYLTTTMAWRGRELFRVLFLDKKNQLIVDEVMNDVNRRPILTPDRHAKLTPCAGVCSRPAAKRGAFWRSAARTSRRQPRLTLCRGCTERIREPSKRILPSRKRLRPVPRHL